ncbi:MAG: peroxiredoxin [Candidatus Hodarchaeales archaeon]
MIQIGDRIPDFETTTDSGKPISSSELKGKKFVLYFYPRDSTPGCTKEACSFRDNYEVFTAKDISIFGVSGGKTESHQKFRKKHNLPFPLLMDQEYELAKLFGVYKRGRRVSRVTFLVNENGIVEGIFGGPIGIEKVKTSHHAEQIAEFWFKA